MRALLVVNPNATTTSALVSDVLVRALASGLDLVSVATKDRGHGAELGRRARAEGFDLVIAFGGDGTVNEVVNGMLHDGPGAHVPDLAVIPGGSTNVFARSLGLPTSPVEATGRLLAAVSDDARRTISLGRADERWFTFCAGMGFDAEIVGQVERHRAAGTRSTHALYVRTAVRHYLRPATRREGPIRVVRPGQPDVGGVFMAIVANATPWTYLGERPIEPLPRTSLEGGLDLAALTGLGPLSTARQALRLLTGRDLRGRRVLVAHDLPEVTLRASRPVAFQVDGDYVGEREQVRFTVTPHALRVVV